MDQVPENQQSACATVAGLEGIDIVLRKVSSDISVMKVIINFNFNLFQFQLIYRPLILILVVILVDK